MKPLFTTTVATLILQTEARISELKSSIQKAECEALSSAKNCESFSSLQTIMQICGTPVEHSLLLQYENDLDYLTACCPQQEVVLDKTEWKHYFTVCARPELC